MEIPQPLRSLWSVAGHVSTLHWLASIGIGIAAAALAWGRRFLGDMDTVPRLLVIFGLCLVVVAGSLALLRLVFGGPPLGAATPRDITALEGEVEKAKTEIANLKDEKELLQKLNDQFREQAVEARMAQIEAEAGLENCRNRARHYYEIVVYGQELPTLRPIDPGQLTLLVMSLHELLPDLNGLIGGARQVWESILQHSRQHHKETAIGGLVEVCNTTERARFETAVTDLLARLRDRGDPRAYLAHTYTRYRTFRARLLYAAKTMGLSVIDLPGYVQWSTSETRFMSDLRKKLAIQELSDPARVIGNYDQNSGGMPPI